MRGKYTSDNLTGILQEVSNQLSTVFIWFSSSSNHSAKRIASACISESRVATSGTHEIPPPVIVLLTPSDVLGIGIAWNESAANPPPIKMLVPHGPQRAMLALPAAKIALTSPPPSVSTVSGTQPSPFNLR